MRKEGGRGGRPPSGIGQRLEAASASGDEFLPFLGAVCPS
jgi:hypothetical protein